MHNFTDGWSFWKVDEDVMTDDDFRMTTSNTAQATESIYYHSHTNLTANGSSSTTTNSKSYNGVQLLRKNNNKGIYLKKIVRVNKTSVFESKVTDKKFTKEKKVLLVCNASNPKVWFTGDKDQPIILAYEAPSSW